MEKEGKKMVKGRRGKQGREKKIEKGGLRGKTKVKRGK